MESTTHKLNPYQLAIINDLRAQFEAVKAEIAKICYCSAPNGETPETHTADLLIDSVVFAKREKAAVKTQTRPVATSAEFQKEWDKAAAATANKPKPAAKKK